MRKNIRKNIYLPHLNYTVRIRPFQPPPDSISSAQAWIRRDDRCGCTIFFNAKGYPSGLAHEIVHALRFICIDRHMTFEDECEHMAYLMEYIMGTALGLRWVKMK